jgi:hypothetical protein
VGSSVFTLGLSLVRRGPVIKRNALD